MDQAQIRRFRRSLRRFERLNTYQLKRCCTEVTFAQCLVLLEIDEAGRPTMGDLAARLRLDNSTLSRTIEGLVGRRMVERLPDESDRRAVRIGLTAAGRSACRAIHRDSDACVLRLFDKIPASRRDAVIRDFETLVNAFLDWEVETAVQGCGNLKRSVTSRKTAARRGG